MMNQFQNAPLSDGILELTEAQILTIRKELREIESAFKPNVNMANCTVHYIVDKHNEKSSIKINGDTASYILGYMTEQEMQSLEDTPVAE